MDILKTVYNDIVPLHTWLSQTLGLTKDVHETELTLEHDPKSFRSLLTSIYVGAPADLKLPYFTSSQHSNLKDIVLRAVERNLKKKSPVPNILTLGCSLRSTDTGAHSSEGDVEIVYPNSSINLLRSKPWEILHSRIGDALLLFILQSTSLFLEVEPTCFIQLTGTPVYSLLSDRPPSSTVNTPGKKASRKNVDKEPKRKTQPHASHKSQGSCDNNRGKVKKNQKKTDKVNSIPDSGRARKRKFEKVDDSKYEELRKLADSFAKGKREEGCIQDDSFTRSIEQNSGEIKENKKCRMTEGTFEVSKIPDLGKKFKPSGKRKLGELEETSDQSSATDMNGRVQKRQKVCPGEVETPEQMECDGETSEDVIADCTNLDLQGSYNLAKRERSVSTDNVTCVDSNHGKEVTGGTGMSKTGKGSETNEDVQVNVKVEGEASLVDSDKLEAGQKDRMMMTEEAIEGSATPWLDWRKKKQQRSSFKPFDWGQALPRHSYMYRKKPRESISKYDQLQQLNLDAESLASLYNSIFVESKVLSSTRETIIVEPPTREEWVTFLEQRNSAKKPVSEISRNQRRGGNDSVPSLHVALRCSNDAKKDSVGSLSGESLVHQHSSYRRDTQLLHFHTTDSDLLENSNIASSLITTRAENRLVENNNLVRHSSTSDKTNFNASENMSDNISGKVEINEVKSGVHNSDKELLLRQRKNMLLKQRLGNSTISMSLNPKVFNQNIPKDTKVDMDAEFSPKIEVQFPVSGLHTNQEKQKHETSMLTENAESVHDDDNKGRNKPDTHTPSVVCKREMEKQKGIDINDAVLEATQVSNLSESADNVTDIGNNTGEHLKNRDRQNINLVEYSLGQHSDLAIAVIDEKIVVQNGKPDSGGKREEVTKNHVTCDTETKKTVVHDGKTDRGGMGVEVANTQEMCNANEEQSDAADASVKISCAREMMQVLADFIVNHRRCPYTSLLNQICPSTLEKKSTKRHKRKGFRKSTESLPALLQKHSAPRKVFLFLRRCILKTFPLEMFGSAENRNSLLKNLSRMLAAGRYDKLSLGQLMSGLKTKQVSWLKSYHSNSVRLHLLAKLVYWVFTRYIFTVLGSYFYVTDTTFVKYRLLYYRQALWTRIQYHGIIGLIRQKTLTPLSEDEVSRLVQTEHSLGVSALRFLPKEKSLRPIINMGFTDRLAADKSISINKQLSSLHQVLAYLKDQKRSLLGFAKLGTDDIYSAWLHFAEKWRGLGQPPMFFVKTDISRCYDSITQDKLYNILEQILQQELTDDELVVRKYMLTKRSRGTVKTKFVKHVDALSEFDSDFVSFSRDLIKRKHLRNVILMDRVVYQHETPDSVLDKLHKHLFYNVVKVGNQYYRQQCGISQGSVISTLLCGFYYADMERKVFNIDQNDFLLRIVDDYMYITASKSRAQTFLQQLMKGFPEYNCNTNVEKVLTNFPCPGFVSVDSDWFPWCGMMFNTRTLEVATDYSRLRGVRIEDTVAYDFSSHPGAALQRKILSSASQKCHAIFLDGVINSRQRILRNIYLVCLLAAFKFHSYVRKLPHKQRTQSNRKFFLSVIQSVASLVYWHYSKAQKNGQPGNTSCICRDSVMWLCVWSFHQKLGEHPSQYSSLLKKMKRRKTSLEKNLGTDILVSLHDIVEEDLPDDFKLIL